MHLYEERSFENTRVEESGMQSPSPVIRLHPDDDVVIARRQLVGGERIAEENLVVAGLIPPAHKIATRRIAKGQPVRRWSQACGSCAPVTRPHDSSRHTLEARHDTSESGRRRSRA